jgi:hypothetical protein
MRSVTHIIAILKLPQILRKMLRADMDMCAVNPALQLRPKAFDGIDASTARLRVFFGGMIDRYVPIAVQLQIFVTAKFVSMDRGAGQDVGIDKRVHGGLSAAWRDACNQLAITLQHPDNARLIALVAASHTGNGTANQRFVNLDFFANSSKRVVTIKLRHILADFMAHAPRRFVGNPNLAFDFLGRNTITRSAKLEHDKKPIAQAGASAVKGCSSGRIDLRAAPFASVRATGFDAVELRVLATLSAIVTLAKSGAHKVVKAAFFGGEKVLKLAKGSGFRFHSYYVADCLTCRKGIIAKQVQGDGCDSQLKQSALVMVKANAR